MLYLIYKQNVRSVTAISEKMSVNYNFFVFECDFIAANGLEVSQQLFKTICS